MEIISKTNSNKVANLGFVASLLVVFIHLSEPSTMGLSWVCHYMIRHVVAPIAVPYFFVVSGYFIAAHSENPGWWVCEVTKRIRSLCVPFIIWNFLYTVLLCLLSYLNLGDYSKDLTWNAVTGIGGGKPALISLWYVRALFMFVLASPVIFWAVRTCSLWGVICVGSVYVGAKFYVDSSYWKTFWEYVIPLGGCMYYMLGVFIFKHPNPVKLSSAMTVSLGMFGIVIGLTGMMCRLYIDDCGQTMARAMRLVSIPFVLIGGWSFICHCRWPKWIIRAAFPIYLIHMFIIKVVGVVCNKLGVSYAESLFGTVIVYFIVVAISLAIAALTQLYFEKLGKLLYGGR